MRKKRLKNSPERRKKVTKIDYIKNDWFSKKISYLRLNSKMIFKFIPIFKNRQVFKCLTL